MKISGFGFWVYDSKEAKAVLKHVWLIGRRQIRRDLDFLIIITPQGPPRLVHNLMLVWKYERFYLKKITVGRTIPPLGRELQDVRIDNTETINYPGLASSQVARDDGLQIDSQVGRLQLATAIFAGDKRVGGFADERENGRPHFYQRVRLTLPWGVVAGASFRLSQKDRQLWGLEAARETKNIALIFETLNHEGAPGSGARITEWSALAAYSLNKNLRLVFRYEQLENGTLAIPGLRLLLGGQNCEIKLNAVLGEKQDKVLGQLIIRF